MHPGAAEGCDLLTLILSLTQPTGTPTATHRSTVRTPPQESVMSDDLKPPDLATWQRLFDDTAYWQQSPDAHYTELQRVADDLLGQGAIDLEQWQTLKARAEQSHKDSPAINIAQEVDDPQA